MSESGESDKLLAAARSVRAHAYAPYSRFAVGAALLGESGRIHVGVNVENASYSECQCAEASAIGALIAAGDHKILAAAIVGPGAEPCLPCGGCRQRLAEFSAPDTPLYCGSAEGVTKTTSLGALLPLAFGPMDLERR